MVTQFHHTPGLPSRQERYHQEANRLRRVEWLERPGAARLLQWLTGTGEYAPTTERDERCTDGHWEGPAPGQRCTCADVPHPLVAKGQQNEFVRQMAKTVEQWGGLTIAQHMAALRAFDRCKELLDAAPEPAPKGAPGFVGTVGQRADVILTVKRMIEYSNNNSYPSYLHICEDPDGNEVVYKGSNVYAAGREIHVRVSVMKHEYRNGRPQTIVGRPKLLTHT